MDRYQLKNGFQVIKADNLEFAKYHMIYKLEKSNVWFPTKMEQVINLYSSFPNLYWINLYNERVGGVMLEPNWFGFFFLISPYKDELTALKKILDLVVSISDKNKPIIAYGIHQSSIDNFHKLGFVIEETEKTMLCPTKQSEITWNDNVYLDIPKKDNLKQLISLYYDVFSKSNVECIAKKGYDFYEKLLEGQLSELIPEYSTLLYDKLTNKLIASCTVNIWNDLPHILDIVVRPTHQGLGLGKMMIKKVLNFACKDYIAVRLSVNSGNKAEYLYYKLGFIDGVATSKMRLGLK